MSERTATLLFDDEYYDGQLVRTIGKAGVGLADVGEGGGHGPRGWQARPRPLVRRVVGAGPRGPGMGRDGRRPGERARGGYLHAAEYHRQSYFFLRHDPTDPRLLDACARHVDAFLPAVPLLATHVERLRFAVGDTALAFAGQRRTPPGNAR